MSESTNKLFWISALGIVVTIVCVTIFWAVKNPTKNLYGNTDNNTLCGASERADSLICLDASNNSKLGNHTNNEGTDKELWYSQANLEEKNDGYASLSGFDFNEKSGWLEYALLFDGVNDRLSLNLPNSNFSDGMTLQVNTKILDASINTPIITNGNITISIKNNHIVYTLKTGGTYEIVSDKEVVSGDWYLIQATYNNDRMKLYVNGMLDKDLEISGSIPTTSTDFTLSPSSSIELSSVMIYSRDIKLTGINQNTEAIYRKIYSIDAYRENFSPVSEGCQLWTAPMTGEYQVELWGAQGGSLGTGQGGNGAYTSGNIVLNKGDTFYVCVGKKGTTSTNLANGGESSDIRVTFEGNKTDFNSLKSRIMIAAAGGGGNNAIGGAGGELTGLGSPTDIEGVRNPKGGSQTAGGERATKYEDIDSPIAGQYLTASNGKYFSGGTTTTGATGGQGHYGGGSISFQGGAGGGSSYISGHTGVNSILEESTVSAIVHSGSVKHYSTIMFYSTKMINGRGNMPSSNHIDEFIYGQTGDGHARISYISSDVVGHASGGESLKPGQPELINATTSSSSITANYSAVANASNYVCYYGLSEETVNYMGTVVSLPNGNKQCNIYGLEENTDYFIKMDAINGDQRTSSEITKVTTEYTTPSIPVYKNAEIGVNEVVSHWQPSAPVTDYICSVGTSSNSFPYLGKVEIKDDEILCSLDGLNQNSSYYFRLTAINGDMENNNYKTSNGVSPKITTDYAEPDKPVLSSSSKTYSSITNKYIGSLYYTDYTCAYGLNEDNLEFVGDVSINSQKIPSCYAEGLVDGTTYYFQLTAINGNKEVKSDINAVTTNYREIDAPVQTSVVVTNNSITALFTGVERAESYICYIGTTVEGMTQTGVGIAMPGGDIQCNFFGLNQNTTYYYKLQAIHGDKNNSSINYEAHTLYNDPTIAEFIKSTVSGTTIETQWRVTEQDEEYICQISNDDGDSVDITLDQTIKNGILTCRFPDLSSDTTYQSNVKSINGDKSAQSAWHKDAIGLILPSVETNISGGIFEESNKKWSYTPFDLNISVDSDDIRTLYGLVYCTGSSECTPSYDFSNEIDEETDLKTIKLTPKNGTKAVVSQAQAFTESVRINETNSTYVCAQAITTAGRTSQVQCFGPYKVEKLEPILRIASLDKVEDNIAYLTYSYGGDGTITVTSSDESVAKVKSSGSNKITLDILSSGEVTIKVKSSATDRYKAMEDEITLLITADMISESFNPSSKSFVHSGINIELTSNYLEFDPDEELGYIAYSYYVDDLKSNIAIDFDMSSTSSDIDALGIALRFTVADNMFGPPDYNAYGYFLNYHNGNLELRKANDNSLYKEHYDELQLIKSVPFNLTNQHVGISDIDGKITVYVWDKGSSYKMSSDYAVITHNAGTTSSNHIAFLSGQNGKISNITLSEVSDSYSASIKR